MVIIAATVLDATSAKNTATVFDIRISAKGAYIFIIYVYSLEFAIG